MYKKKIKTQSLFFSAYNNIYEKESLKPYWLVFLFTNALILNIYYDFKIINI